MATGTATKSCRVCPALLTTLLACLRDPRTVAHHGASTLKNSLIMIAFTAITVMVTIVVLLLWLLLLPVLGKHLQTIGNGLPNVQRLRLPKWHGCRTRAAAGKSAGSNGPTSPSSYLSGPLESPVSRPCILLHPCFPNRKLPEPVHQARHPNRRCWQARPATAQTRSCPDLTWSL